MSKKVAQGPVFEITVEAPAGGVSAGDVIVGADNSGFGYGGGLGVYNSDAAAGEPVSLIVEGIVELPKTAGEAFSSLDVCYWDSTGEAVTTDSTSAPVIGMAVKPAAAGDASIIVYLH